MNLLNTQKQSANQRLKELIGNGQVFNQITYLGEQKETIFSVTRLGARYLNDPTTIRLFDDGFEFFSSNGAICLFVATLKTCFYYNPN